MNERSRRSHDMKASLPSEDASRTPECPSFETLYELFVEKQNEDLSEDFRKHLLTCDYCITISKLLMRASEDSEVELSPVQQEKLREIHERFLRRVRHNELERYLTMFLLENGQRIRWWRCPREGKSDAKVLPIKFGCSYELKLQLGDKIDTIWRYSLTQNDVDLRCEREKVDMVKSLFKALAELQGECLRTWKIWDDQVDVSILEDTTYKCWLHINVNPRKVKS